MDLVDPIWVRTYSDMGQNIYKKTLIAMSNQA